MTEENNNTAHSTIPVRGSGVQVQVFGRTDVGMVRDHNEDNFLVADLSNRNRSIRPEVQNHEIGAHGSIFAVCDGMGGAAAGEVASQIAVDTIYEMMQGGGDPADVRALAVALNEAICEAGKRIFSASRINRGQRGMGTTTTAAVLCGPRIVFGQVGDSRAHIIRNGGIFQTTKDQSLVQQLIDAKQLTVEEARNFDRSNIILQALGTTEEVHVDLTSILLRRGDVLVMCSDGLSGLVMPEAILEVVLSTPDPAEACQRLTQMACDNGGDDNITVIIARFDGEVLEPPRPGDDPGYEKFFIHEPTEVTAVGVYPKNPRTKSDPEPPSPDQKTPSVPPARPEEPEGRLSITGTGKSRRLIMGVVATVVLVIVLVGVVLLVSKKTQVSEERGVHVLPAEGLNASPLSDSVPPAVSAPGSTDVAVPVSPGDTASSATAAGRETDEPPLENKTVDSDGSIDAAQASQENEDTVRLKTRDASERRESVDTKRPVRAKKPVEETETGDKPVPVEANPYL